MPAMFQAAWAAPAAMPALDCSASFSAAPADGMLNLV
jgi:hypothetical protein